MRIFGREIEFDVTARWPIKAAAPKLPPKVGNPDTALSQKLPPFGTNPPVGALAGVSSDLSERLVHNDPRELWYLALPSKLTPQQVVTILRSALGGDLWQQWQLLSLMLDSWPMFRKCAHELRQAASIADYHVHPYSEEGEDPTQTAQEKAKLVRRALKQMRPDPTTDEQSFQGTVYDLTDGLLNGLTMQEVMWQDNKGEIMPRATAWVHPRHFTFGNDGRIYVFDAQYNRLVWSTAQSSGYGPDQNKFLIGQFRSRSGSSLGAGLMRPLAWYWSSVVFGREWMLKVAQKFGAPFIDMTYKQGMDDQLDNMRKMAATAYEAGYWLHREGTTVEFHPPTALGPDSPQMALMKQADEACQILLLGQTATTHGTAGKLGNDSTREKVKRENVEGLAQWVGTILTDQLSRAIIRMNYGNEDEVPTVKPDFTEATDPQEQAQRDAVFITNKVPLIAEEFYKRNNLTMPEEGDKVLVGGEIGVMAAQDTEVGAVQEAPEPGSELPGAPGQDKVPGSDLERAVANATDAELEDLKSLVVKAKEAEHLNGEWDAVNARIKQLASKAAKVPAKSKTRKTTLKRSIKI